MKCRLATMSAIVRLNIQLRFAERRRPFNVIFIITCSCLCIESALQWVYSFRISFHRRGNLRVALNAIWTDGFSVHRATLLRDLDRLINIKLATNKQELSLASASWLHHLSRQSASFLNDANKLSYKAGINIEYFCYGKRRSRYALESFRHTYRRAFLI